jgi:hypothetical protein
VYAAAEANVRREIYLQSVPALARQRMPGLVITGGDCKEMLPDKSGPKRWLESGLEKRAQVLQGTSLKKSRSKAFSALRWLCLMLSETGALVVPSGFDTTRKGSEFEVDAATAVLASGVMPAVVALLQPETAEYGGEFKGQRTTDAQWQVLAAWFVANLAASTAQGSQQVEEEDDEEALRQQCPADEFPNYLKERDLRQHTGVCGAIARGGAVRCFGVIGPSQSGGLFLMPAAPCRCRSHCWQAYYNTLQTLMFANSALGHWEIWLPPR